MSLALEFYKNISDNSERNAQCEYVDKLLQEHFLFDKIEFIETGVSSGNYDNFGLYFGKLVEETNGIYNTVDISEKFLDDARKSFEKLLPTLNVNLIHSDSVQYLNLYQGQPNLVHLDSYDLDITNPIPSMLHHWLEFIAIKDKMPKGSFLLIDDNYMKGTVVYWNIYDENKNLIDVKPTDINYEMLGKGALIYFAIKDGKINDWEILGSHYLPGLCLKLILKKI